MMLHDWLKSTDNAKDKTFVHFILLDYAKTFDHMDPNILMKKIQGLYIPYCLLRWTESFSVR